MTVFEGEKMFEWDNFTDDIALVQWQSPLFDGDISPHSVVESAPRQFIPSWNESTREWRIVISRHPVSTARLRDAFREAKKRYGQIKAVAAFVEKDGFRDGQTIAVLRSMGFSKHDARGTPHAVCYVRDLKKQKIEPKIEPTPLVELKGWAKEFEAVQVRMEHKRLTGALTEADTETVRWYEEQIAQEEAARGTQDTLALDAQIAELQKQIDELKGKTCQS
jgi:hypothetical protein